MKYYRILLILVLLLSGCISNAESGIQTQGEIIPQKSASGQKSCGDGICNGPETTESCPVDCQDLETSPSDPSSDIPPMYFFYTIHTHGSDEFLPFSDLGQTSIDPEIADNMIAAISGIAAVLDHYGVKASWQFLPATVKGFYLYQGEDNIITQLLENGHEIGVHTHKLDDVQDAYENIQQFIGITPETTSGFIAQISKVSPGESKSDMSFAIDVPVKLGLNVGTVNLSPGGEKNTISSECKDVFGIGNDMWAETGNLMFPWRPDYIHQDPCSHNPQGEMLFIDHVSINWLILPDKAAPPDVLDTRHFSQLTGMFDGALNYMAENRPDRPATWGFVTHIIEYAVGGKGENAPTPESLTALDDFLAYVDTKHQEGLVIYATPGEINNIIEGSE